MKRIILLLLCIALGASLFTACGKKDEAASVESTTVQNTEGPSVDENGFPLDYDRSGHLFPYSEDNPITDIILRYELKGQMATGDERFDKREVHLKDMSTDGYVLDHGTDFVLSLTYGEEKSPDDTESGVYRSLCAVYADGTEVSAGYDYAEKDGKYYALKICEGGDEEFRYNVFSARDIIEAEYEQYLSDRCNVPVYKWVLDIFADEGALWEYTYEGELHSAEYCLDSVNTPDEYSAPYPMVACSEPEDITSENRLTYKSSEAAVQADFYLTERGEYLRYSDGQGEKWYLCKVLEDHAGSLPSAVIAAFRYKYFDLRNRPFEASSAQAAVEYFADTLFCDSLIEDRFGSREYLDYELMEYEIQDSNSDGAVFYLSYAVKPEVQSEDDIAGNLTFGEGEYEGWYLNCIQVLLRRGEDGLWRFIGAGTGGYTLE